MLLLRFGVRNMLAPSVRSIKLRPGGRRLFDRDIGLTAMWQPPLVNESKVKREQGARIVGSPVPIVAIGALLGIPLTIPAMYLAYMSTGGGHGDYLYAGIFYPVPLFIRALTGGDLYPIAFRLAAIQFSIYGGVIAYCATVSQRAAIIAGLALAAVHASPWLLFFVAAIVFRF